jgi:hypothetical protein
MRVPTLLALLIVGVASGCSSDEDVRKTTETSSQRWSQPWENGGYDQNADWSRPYYGSGR